jgi:hypothetical protein
MNIYNIIMSKICESCFINSFFCKCYEYRQFDGSNNNHHHTDYGKINTPLIKLFNHDYSDGTNNPSGNDRPSAREISNSVGAQKHPSSDKNKISNMFWLWGQFLDHDITLIHTNNEKFPIKVPKGDNLIFFVKTMF